MTGGRGGKEYFLSGVSPEPVGTSAPPLSFGPLLAILGVATVVGVGVVVVLGVFVLIPVVMAVVLGAGLVYLLATGTSEPLAAPATAGAPDEEPFEDPVEEADRLESSGAPLEPPPPATAPVGPAPSAASRSDGDDAK
ncbi:MAG: hypothetical protein L3K14_06850 [Thermoplasmata archaeon]|nr:hypothetical protein [Thermoplasmata archaeon]